jgi:hypothetical protein
MVNNIRFLSSRRSYEFRADDISLTLLSNQGVLQHVRDAFSFTVASPGPPMETFGPVVPSLPPGLIFDYGATPFPEDSGTSIRYMHIEQRRIVMDVAGPSAVIAPTFDRLRDLLSGLRTSEGLPAIGEPVSTRDYSEISFTMPSSPDTLLPEALRPIYREALRGTETQDYILVPSLQVKLLLAGSEYPGYGRNHESAHLELRAGTEVRDGVFFSGAPVNSDTHVAMLNQLADALASQGQ